ncbi:hypothetical protein SLS56_008814 [Neofusicoccum ribis]|uniref:Uncharacterized protein n=1 Tax=Neofusicoccum ribis TaxID=45134 RepID=A0ABR3SJ14_9PEZI
MASDANPPPDRWCLLNDAPVVVEWPGGVDGHAAFFGHARPATLLLAHDAAQQTAAFRIRIPFQLQSSRKGHGFLYAFIDPATIILVQRRSRDTSLPEPVAHSLVGKRSAHGIVGLELDLSKPPVIVGPANATKLSPRGDAAGNTLASLRLLSHATQGFCTAASGGSLSPSIKDHALDTLYMGEGGKDVGGFLAPFEFRQADAQESDEAPPSYDDATPVPSKRPASRETSPPPPRKKTIVPASKSQPTSPQQPEPTPVQLRLELDILKQQMAFRAGTPTEDGSLLDRFDGFEQRLTALEARVAN